MRKFVILGLGILFIGGLLLLGQGQSIPVVPAGTGGTSQVLQQPTLNGPITVGQLACGNLSDATASCNTDATNASNISSGALAVARGGSGGAGATYFLGNGYQSGTTNVSSNLLLLSGITIPDAIPSAGHLVFQVTTADGTNNADVCLYSKAGSLVAHTGAQHFGSTGVIVSAISGGAVSVPAGAYYAGFTSVGGTLVVTSSPNQFPTFYSFGVATGISTSGGACPGSITPPADAWLIKGVLMGFGIAP
jgi:hypothetical protein